MRRTPLLSAVPRNPFQSAGKQQPSLALSSCGSQGGKRKNTRLPLFPSQSQVASKLKFSVLKFAVATTGPANKSRAYAHCPPGVEANSTKPLYFPCNFSWCCTRKLKSRKSSSISPSWKPRRNSRMPAGKCTISPNDLPMKTTAPHSVKFKRHPFARALAPPTRVDPQIKTVIRFAASPRRGEFVPKFPLLGRAGS